MKIKYMALIIVLAIWITIGIVLYVTTPDMKITDIYLTCAIGTGISIAGYTIIKEKEQRAKEERQIHEAQMIIAKKILKEEQDKNTNGS